MGQLAKFVLALFVFVVFTAIPVTSVQAAPGEAPPTAKLKVRVDIDPADVFWKCTFLNEDADLGKPTEIKLTWSVGQLQRQEKSQTIVAAGKSSGEAFITAEKGALVNIQIAVCDSRGVKHGYTSIQVRNNGQTENISISLPESFEPKITWGNL